jgi:protein gp37
MSDHSSIEWTDATWNPTRGCDKIAPGCKNCYAERFAERFRGVAGHPYEQGFDPRLAPDKLAEPLKWKAPRRIFVDSMSDLFHDAFPFEYIAACFGVMAACPQHTFQVLTKRPARAVDFFAWLSERGGLGKYIRACTSKDAERHGLYAYFKGLTRTEKIRGYTVRSGADPWMQVFNAAACTGGSPLRNVEIGTSIANQVDADKNVPALLRIPAAIRFLSVEPLLGEINFRWTPYAHQSTGESYRDYAVRNGSVNEYEALRKIDWVIVGGESGARARPMDPRWVRSLRDQCVAAGVPFFFKQHGEFIGVDDMERLPLSAPELSDPHDYFREHTFRLGDHCEGVHCGALSVYRVGKKVAGRMLDGRTWDEFPRTNPVQVTT